jgi:hypothetical protein
MTIKVQCPCGAKYSFEVEPVEGRMPFAVNCPACNADGTEMANELIAAQAGPPKLRVHIAQPAAEAPVGPAPIPRPPPVSTLERLRAERRQSRRIGWILSSLGVVALALLGAWVWFVLVGSKPSLEYSMKFPEADPNVRARFLDAGTILLVNRARATVHDLAKGTDLWSTVFPQDSSNAAEGTQLRTFVDKTSVWIFAGRRILQFNRATGEFKNTVSIDGQLESFTSNGSNILAVVARDETTRMALQIDPESGQVRSEIFKVPRPEKFELPDELPHNVAPTEGVLLSRELDDKKSNFNKPLDAMSSDFYFAGDGLVELRVKLLEPKVRYVQSINERATSTGSFADTEGQVISDIKRSQKGGVNRVDESRYEVTLRRWTGATSVEWTNDVIGHPAFFPLKTVDLLVAGPWLAVFDRQTRKLFDAKLSYSISDRFGPEEWDHRSAPALEDNGALYFFDQGVLTAYSLPGGDVRWRVTSIGITKILRDDTGMLYVDSTTAAPESIQYSGQVSGQPPEPVVLKIDPASGKILWQAINLGQECCVSGKYLYSSSLNLGGMGMLRELAESLNAPQQEAPFYFHIYRLDPATGKSLWDFYRIYGEYPDGSPKELSFQQNRFLIRFTDRVQVWKFLTF